MDRCSRSSGQAEAGRRVRHLTRSHPSEERCAEDWSSSGSSAPPFYTYLAAGAVPGHPSQPGRPISQPQKLDAGLPRLPLGAYFWVPVAPDGKGRGAGNRRSGPGPRNLRKRTGRRASRKARRTILARRSAIARKRSEVSKRSATEQRTERTNLARRLAIARERLSDLHRVTNAEGTPRIVHRNLR